MKSYLNGSKRQALVQISAFNIAQGVRCISYDFMIDRLLGVLHQNWCHVCVQSLFTCKPEMVLANPSKPLC